MDIPIPILSSVIGALSAMIVMLLREVLDRGKTTRLAKMTITWLAQSIKYSLTKDSVLLSHLDLGILKNSVTDIARSSNLRSASFLLQEVYCLWKSGVYLHKDLANPIILEANTKLDKAIAFAGGS